MPKKQGIAAILATALAGMDINYYIDGHMPQEKRHFPEPTRTEPVKTERDYERMERARLKRERKAAKRRELLNKKS